MADRIATFALNREMFREIVLNTVEHPRIRSRLHNIIHQSRRGETKAEQELFEWCTNHDTPPAKRLEAEALVRELYREGLAHRPTYYRREKHGPVIFEGECDIETFKNSKITCYGWDDGTVFWSEHDCIDIVIREDDWWEDIQEMRRLLIDGDLDNVLRKEPLTA